MPSGFHTSFPRGHSEALFHTRVLPPCNRMPATHHNCSANMLYTARVRSGSDNAHVIQERENVLPFPQLHLHIRSQKSRGISGSPCSPRSAWWMSCSRTKCNKSLRPGTLCNLAIMALRNTWRMLQCHRLTELWLDDPGAVGASHDNPRTPNVHI